jgi:outer membrane protein TolC
MKNALISMLVILSGHTKVLANTIPLSAVFESIKAYHPSMKAMNAKREQTEFLSQRARGEFDLQFNQESRLRTSGYYDGQYIDQTITKPLEIYGADITARYRRGDGAFPIYEDYSRTESGGEASIGISLSLLKNSRIDSRRIGIKNADNQLSIGLSQEQIEINNLLFQGINAYLSWYRAFKQTQAISDLVTLALVRRKGMHARVASGDLAEISKVEFETTLLRRQANLLQAKQSLRQSQQRLSFYWRSSNGQQKIINDTHFPSDDLVYIFKKVIFDEVWQELVLNNHPEIARLEGQVLVAKNELRLAQNNYLPTLDLELKVAEDLGTGSQSLNGTETFVGLTFSMPLERRKERAERSIASVKLKEFTFKKQALVDRLRNDLNINITQLTTLEELAELRKNQADMAKLLEQQEYIRFDAGDSEQFLLNTRETEAGQATLDAIEALIRWWQKKIQLIAISGQLNQIS